MLQLNFHPGRDFAGQAAVACWHFLAHCGADEAAAHVVVPTAAQIPGIRQALDAAARDAGRPRLLPRVLTLGHWLLDLPPDDTPVRLPAARLLAVQQAVRAQDWLRRAFGAQTEGAAWGLAQTLLTICDELSARWLDGDEIDGEDRADLLQGALERTYARLSERFLGEEARIVLAFWQALSGPDDPLPARQRALTRLAAQAGGPIVWISPTPPTPLEAAFLRQAAEVVPVMTIGYDWAGEPADGGAGLTDPEANALPGWYDTLLALWPETRLPADPGRPALLPPLPADRPRLRVIGSPRFEDEAIAAADQLVRWLNEGRRNVALVAHDRVVARRARALLARAGAPVRDETGWKLSTTRAAAALMRWFDLLARDGDTSALLDLLKSPFCLPDVAGRGAGIALLERQVRREGISGGWQRLRQLFSGADPVAQDDDDTAATRAAAREAARTLVRHLADEAHLWPRGHAQQSLATWLDRLDATLDRLGMRATLDEDDAGRQLLAALARLHELPHDETGADATLSQAEFRAMLSALLESVAYKEPTARSTARITILPLNGARMRRFDGVVIVGCDDAQLPSTAAELMFFSNQMRRELSLEDREARFAQQARDLAEVLLNNDDVVMTWQKFGGRGEPKHVSGWVERLSACCAKAGAPIEAGASPQVHETDATPAGMPAPPAAPDLVPERWSAQAYNMLRRCPYQFFAGRLLGLSELEAVSDELEKRDIGELLHRVLLQYHKELQGRREAGEHPGTAAQLARLRQISDDVFGAVMADDGNAIGYYRRWCEVLPSYVAWQAAREAQGWFWRGGELDAGIDLPMPDGRPLRLTGRIDRLDRGPQGEHAVLDYKTQNATRLKRKLAEVEEDCQLPFYGLLRADARAGSWVSLEGAKEAAKGAASAAAGGQREVGLPDFDAAVQWLERQMRSDVMRLRASAPLPAFGDPSACTFCTARGLCRKGFWETTAVPDLNP